MSRQKFLAHYREALLSTYEWARSDPAKLERFMLSVEETLASKHSTWRHVGDAVTVAWRSMGGRGKPTLKQLRALT